MQKRVQFYWCGEYLSEEIMTAAGLMAGKKGLIMGVANERSIAWGITKALKEQGAELPLPIKAMRY